MSPGERRQVVLTRTKDSKHMHKYELVIPEDEHRTMYASIYIHKADFKNKQVPEEVQITITPVWK